MKSENISKHFQTLHVQRNEFLPSSPFTISRTTMVSPAEWKMVYWGAFLSLIFNCKNAQSSD